MIYVGFKSINPISSFLNGETAASYLCSDLSLYFFVIYWTAGISNGALYFNTEDRSSFSMFGLYMRGILGLMMTEDRPFSGVLDGI